MREQNMQNMEQLAERMHRMRQDDPEEQDMEQLEERMRGMRQDGPENDPMYDHLRDPERLPQFYRSETDMRGNRTARVEDMMPPPRPTPPPVDHRRNFMREPHSDPGYVRPGFDYGFDRPPVEDEV